jgi:hypothetical protein
LFPPARPGYHPITTASVEALLAKAAPLAPAADTGDAQPPAASGTTTPAAPSAGEATTP